MRRMGTVASVFVSGALAMTLAGCASGGSGSSDEGQQSVQAEQKAKLSLDGKWKQTNSNNPNDSWMEATIDGSTISVNWVTSGGSAKSVYWIGSYDAPETTEDAYSFTSKRNASATDGALLASTDDAKEFSYSGGVLSYDVTMMGTTTTVTLEREGDVDGENSTGTESTEPHVKESGWSYSNGYVNFCAIVDNPDPVNCYVGMPLNVTAKGADGTVLANSTVYASWVAPNDVMPVGCVLSDVSEEPSEVTVDFSHGDGSKPGHDYTLADLPVSNVTDTGKKVTGEFANNTGCDFDRGVTVLAVFRGGGKIVGFAERVDYSNPCPDGKTAAFEVSYAYNGVPAHDSVDVYAVPNLI